MLGFAIVAILGFSIALSSGAISNRWWGGLVAVPLADLLVAVLILSADDGGYIKLGFAAVVLLFGLPPALVGAAVGAAVLRYGREPHQRGLKARVRAGALIAGVLLLPLASAAGVLALVRS